MDLDKDKIIQEIRERNLVNHEFNDNRVWHKLQSRSTKAELDAQERGDLIKMRKHWSCCVLVLIFGIVIFDMVVIIGVGSTWLKFEDNLVPWFIADSLFKIFGLAYIVVKFLFNDKFLDKFSD